MKCICPLTTSNSLIVVLHTFHSPDSFLRFCQFPNSVSAGSPVGSSPRISRASTSRSFVYTCTVCMCLIGLHCCCVLCLFTFYCMSMMFVCFPVFAPRRAPWVFRDVVFQDVGSEHNMFIKPLAHISFRCEVPTPSVLLRVYINY